MRKERQRATPMRIRINVSHYLFATVLGAVVIVAGQSGAMSQSGPQYDELRKEVTDLQQHPGDRALREKIINLALTLDPQPAIPEEARRHFVKAGAIVKEAKAAEDAELAVKEYRDALLLAPWWGDAYFNLGMAAQTANRFDEAITALKLYLLTKPSPNDARAAQDKIYAIEAKKELAATAAQRAAERDAAADRERKAHEVDLSGQWLYECCPGWVVTFQKIGENEFVMSDNNGIRLRFIVADRAFGGPEARGKHYNTKGYIHEGNRRIDFSYYLAEDGKWVDVPIIRK